MRWPFSRKTVVIVVVLAFVALLGYKILFRPRGPAQQGLSTTEVKKGDIGRMLKVSGIVKPFKAWKVVSLANAKIKTIYIKEGDKVAKGQLLIQLDEDELNGKVATAKASYLKALTKMKEVRSWHSSPTFIDAKSSLEINKAELSAKEKEYTQNVQLYKAKAISRNDLDRSKMELDRARADLVKSTATMGEVSAKGGPHARKEAEAELTAAKLALRDAEENLHNKDIRAPAAGIVSIARSSGGGSKGGSSAETTLTVRSTVAPGQVLLIISSTEQLAVDVYVNEYDVLKLYPDQPCLISVPALPGSLFPGRVASITTESSEKLTTFKLRCLIMQPGPHPGDQSRQKEGEPESAKNSPRGSSEQPGGNRQIKVGMTANVIIPLEKKTNVLLVPISALTKQNGRTGVFMMEDGKPVFTEVKVGIISENEAEIVNGLEEGQEILEEVPGSLLKKSADSGEP
jgi:multidrug efflux pump subunit AcrA (membrane-fusion protein)